MSSAPQVYGPDGTLRDKVVFSTTLQTRFFQGTTPSDTVELQVSINGSGYSSGAAYSQWGDGAWTVPNPVYEPNGMLLLEGENTIEVRAVLPSGSVTPVASATVRLVTDADIGIVAVAPTNISVEQKNNNVVVRAETSTETDFQGMNFHASINAGGGITGYTRINVDLVSDGVDTQEEEEFATQQIDLEVAANAEGEPLADPLYFRVTGKQEDVDEVLLQSDYDERFEVPETATKIRVQTSLDQIRDVTLYEFAHTRSAGPTATPPTVRVSAFANLRAEQPLYYVVTAIFYDETQDLEYESSYSSEVVGHPMTVTTVVGSFPAVSRQNIVKEFITAIFRSNPQIKVEAGSVLRDTVIDPYSSESERLRFLLDFYHRARTPTLLLQIDDPTGSGTSVAVANSTYKQGLMSALYITSVTEVQGLIDSAFSAYAGNYGVTRRTGTASQGEVMFYTTKRPDASLLVPLGTVVSGGGVEFNTTRTSSIDTSTLASFYNPITGVYQVMVPVQAASVGSSTNTGVGQVTKIISSLTGGFQVTNPTAMAGGDDTESNLALVARTQNRLASVDSGTERGYLQTAADVPGVTKVNVVAAGNSLMQRDLNADGEHMGGKVDVWVQGENEATVTDTFAFTYEIAQDIQFEVVGAVDDYLFRALDSSLDADNPIVEMLDDPAVGYQFRNASTGEVYDLTDVTYPSYNTIQLDTDLTQPAVDLTDVLLGSYRRRVGSDFILPRQPVSSITSVIGIVSGTIPEDAYLLVHPDAPLETGRSALAGDYLQITGYTDDDGNTVPSGDSTSVSDESHVMVGQYPEYVDNLGANYLSVVVTSDDGLTTYKGPDDSSGDPDYTVTIGTETTALSITRTDTGDIPNGATVLISYEHDENFTITYTTNLIVSLTQDAVDDNKHATADVIVKEAVPVPLDIDATILLSRGQEQSTVDATLRTNMANFFSNLRIGDPVRQSDIIDVIEQTTGVSYVIVPLTKLVRQEGSTVVREEISTDTVAESTLVSTLTTNFAVVYLLTNALDAATTDGGGEEGTFKAVFEDDIEIVLLEASESLNALGVAAGNAYIIGSDGRSIVGISDDDTLIAEGYVTESAIEDRRKELTANHILVSLSIGDAPTSYEYATTYVVGEDSGAKNIDPGDAEFCEEGEFTFTYDEDR